MRLFLNQGALVNAQKGGDRAALHIAAGMGHGKIVELFLEHGADRHVRGRACETPSQVAPSRTFTGVSRLLMGRVDEGTTYLSGVPAPVPCSIYQRSKSNLSSIVPVLFSIYKKTCTFLRVAV